MAHLPLPGGPPSYTRSQRLYTKLTGLSFDVFTIRGNTEYYLFMNMRDEKKWASFRLTTQEWTKMAKEYNIRLERANAARNIKTVPKSPWTLVDKLGEMEATILMRLSKGDFACKHR